MILDESARELTAEDMERMGVGQRFWHVSMDKIPDRLPYKGRIQAYIEKLNECLEEGTGLIFLGPLRAGKTSAAIVIAKHVVGRSGTAYFIRSDDLVSSVIEKRPFDEDETIEERIRSVDLLVIDDLGKEHSKDYGRELVESIIRHRYDHKKSLIVTTNESREVLVDKYGKGTVLVMDTIMIPVVVDGGNWYEKEVKETRAVLGEKRES